MCYTAQKELNQKVNLKMLRITLDYFGAIEIKVLLNQRPMCLFHQPNAVLMVKGSTQYSSKEF